MNNHNLNLETCSFCNLLKGCYPDYISTLDYELTVKNHLLRNHGIILGEISP